MFYSGSPGIIDNCELPPPSRTRRKGAPCEQDNRARFTEYKQIHRWSHMCGCSHTEHRQETWKAPFVELRVCYYSKYASCLGVVCRTHKDTHHTLTHTHARTLFSPAARWVVIGKLTGQHTVAAAKLGRLKLENGKPTFLSPWLNKRSNLSSQLKQ